MSTRISSTKRFAADAESLQQVLVNRWPASKTYTKIGKTELCVDGPPRSANSLLVHKIGLSNPGLKRKLSHHTHDVDSVLLACIARLPVIVPLRDPADSVASQMVFNGGAGLRESCIRYAEFCRLCLEYSDAILLAPFDTVVNDFNAVIRAANQRFSLKLDLLHMPDSEANQIVAERVKQLASKVHGKAWRMRIGVPHEARTQAKVEALGSVVSEPLFALCTRYFKLLSQRAQSTTNAAVET
jgi:hypothetical protein